MASDKLGSSVAKVAKKLKKVEKEIPIEMAAALYQEALVITGVSMGRTPVDTTALRDSHEVSDPRWKGKMLHVDIKVGGPAASYAVAVHERTDARHQPPYGTGGQAKFLESAVLEAQPQLAKRIAKRIDLNRMG